MSNIFTNLYANFLVAQETINPDLKTAARIIDFNTYISPNITSNSYVRFVEIDNGIIFLTDTNQFGVEAFILRPNSLSPELIANGDPRIVHRTAQTQELISRFNSKQAVFQTPGEPDKYWITVNVADSFLQVSHCAKNFRHI